MLGYGSWKQIASGNLVSAKDFVSAIENFIPHTVFDPLVKYNLKASLWECFPEKITKKKKEMLEMIQENPSKYLWSEKDKLVAGFGTIQKEKKNTRRRRHSL